MSHSNNTTSGQLNFTRESYKKEFTSREKWEQKYGKKYKKDLILNGEECKKLKQTRLKHESIKQSYDSDDSDVEEELERLESGNMIGCCTAKFVGGYIPEPMSNVFISTSMQANKTSSSKHQYKDELCKSHFRKSDWLKNYFEEESKAKNIIKSANKTQK